VEKGRAKRKEFFVYDSSKKLTKSFRSYERVLIRKDFDKDEVPLFASNGCFRRGRLGGERSQHKKRIWLCLGGRGRAVSRSGRDISRKINGHRGRPVRALEKKRKKVIGSGPAGTCWLDRKGNTRSDRKEKGDCRVQMEPLAEPGGSRLKKIWKQKKKVRGETEKMCSRRPREEKGSGNKKRTESIACPNVLKRSNRRGVAHREKKQCFPQPIWRGGRIPTKGKGLPAPRTVRRSARKMWVDRRMLTYEDQKTKKKVVRWSRP